MMNPTRLLARGLVSCTCSKLAAAKDRFLPFLVLRERDYIVQIQYIFTWDHREK